MLNDILFLSLKSKMILYFSNQNITKCELSSLDLTKKKEIIHYKVDIKHKYQYKKNFHTHKFGKFLVFNQKSTDIR